MSACAELLGGILALTCYGAMFITVHETFIPSPRNGGTVGDVVAEYNNPHGMGEECIVESSGHL